MMMGRAVLRTLSLPLIVAALGCGGDDVAPSGGGGTLGASTGPTLGSAGRSAAGSGGAANGGITGARAGAGSGSGPVARPTPPAAPITPATPPTAAPNPPIPSAPAPGSQPSAAGAPAAPNTQAPTPTAPAPGGAAAGPPGAMPWNTSGTTCLQAGDGSFAEPGPYRVGTLDVDLGMVAPMQTNGKFTIFYPMPLEERCLHPIVAWGNGTGVADSTTYAFFNSNAAAWGMVVIASQDPNTGSGAFHKAGLDYMLKQNADPSSMFYQKLSPRAGTSGHSQGAFGSVAGASHPNVSVNVGIGGGASTAANHASLCLTGTEDIAAETCPASVNRAQGPFFTASWQGGDHFTTQTLAGYITRNAGSLANQRLYAAWFRCYLADDSVACDVFRGATPDDCGVCKTMEDWAILQSKNVQ
ncbi:MAG: hypothetical protein ABW321_27740 [Polyangiales bacterium]